VEEEEAEEEATEGWGGVGGGEGGQEDRRRRGERCACDTTCGNSAAMSARNPSSISRDSAEAAHEPAPSCPEACRSK